LGRLLDHAIVVVVVVAGLAFGGSTGAEVAGGIG
jgi:hypothetical protein